MIFCRNDVIIKLFKLRLSKHNAVYYFITIARKSQALFRHFYFEKKSHSQGTSRYSEAPWAIIKQQPGGDNIRAAGLDRFKLYVSAKSVQKIF